MTETQSEKKPLDPKLVGEMQRVISRFHLKAVATLFLTKQIEPVTELVKMKGLEVAAYTYILESFDINPFELIPMNLMTDKLRKTVNLLKVAISIEQNEEEFLKVINELDKELK